MSSNKNLTHKYNKYKNKYRKIKQHRLKEGKYFIDKITHPDIDMLYKNKELLYSVKSKFQNIQVYYHNFFGSKF